MKQHIMWQSIACTCKELDLRRSQQTYHCSNQPQGIHPVACNLLLISHPAEGRRLS